jgi:lipopolysaccharide/colanic/teichoic acid biosynthesis glycosyltransferase
LWHFIVLNILLFIPLGFLLRSITDSWKTIVCGFLLSVLIELTQYWFRLGSCELDDVLNNTLGCGLGILLWMGSSWMVLRQWDDLPDFMKTEEVKPYYEALKKKKLSLFFKRAVDLVGGLILLVLLAIPMAVIAVMIKLDSPGPVFYRQERITTYGKHFKIHKFRTMVSNADKIGTAVTVGNDSRITKIGAKLRGCRLDELPQVLDLISGDMSFVGTRPEAVRYVEKYKPEFMATLLLPAGITSEASIRYKDEAELLEAATDPDRVYIEEIVPQKMKYNLKSIKEFSFFTDIATMFRTVFAVLGKEYSDEEQESKV